MALGGLCLLGFVKGCQNLQFIVSRDRVTSPLPQDWSFEELLKTEGILKTEDFSRLKIFQDFTPVSLRRESSLLPECLVDFLKPDQ